MRKRLQVHPWVWAFLFSILLWTLIWASCASGQTYAVDRGGTMFLMREMLGELQGTYLPDTTANKFINYGQHLTMLAMGEKTSLVIDTFITTVGALRYELKNTAATQDTIMAGRIVTVIQKSSSASGSEEVSLAYIPPDLLGKPLSGTVPAFYTVLGRNLLLGKSPLTGDTLFVYMLRVPRDLSAATTALSVSKEDQLAVALAGCVFADLRDNQIARAQVRWQLWQAATGFKGYQNIPTKEQGVEP